VDAAVDVDETDAFLLFVEVRVELGTGRLEAAGVGTTFIGDGAAAADPSTELLESSTPPGSSSLRSRLLAQSFANVVDPSRSSA